VALRVQGVPQETRRLPLPEALKVIVKVVLGERIVNEAERVEVPMEADQLSAGSLGREAFEQLAHERRQGIPRGLVNLHDPAYEVVGLVDELIVRELDAFVGRHAWIVPRLNKQIAPWIPETQGHIVLFRQEEHRREPSVVARRGS
jgi:hypothetical protein